MPHTFHTPSGVRLRRHSQREGPFNWLLLPGGPGIGSESLIELADVMEVPGARSGWWICQGDGSNRNAPGAPANPFAQWPQVLVEAAQALPNAVFLGHSTGGMYLLGTPEVEKHICGLVLVDTAPDASWNPRFVAMTESDPLPEVAAAAAVYEADRRDENIAAIAVASAPWNFSSAGLKAGRALLARMPYNSAAVDWSDTHFDHVYSARWWPQTLPVLVAAGAEDRILWQGGWDEPRFHGANVEFAKISGGGHFLWTENAAEISRVFNLFSLRLTPNS